MDNTEKTKRKRARDKAGLIPVRGEVTQEDLESVEKALDRGAKILRQLLEEKEK